MTAKELFEVLLKITGVWLFLFGIRNLAEAAYFWWQVDLSAHVVGEYLVRATPEILLGLFFLGKTQWLIKLCYRHEDPIDRSE